MRPGVCEIEAALNAERSAGLRVCAQPEIVAAELARIIHDANATCAYRERDQIAELARVDYRLVARALHGRRSPSARHAAATRLAVTRVETLDELQSTEGPALLLLDPAVDGEVQALLASCETGIGEFIEQQFDLPGRNAVFRDGVVKRWALLPGGVRVVSKRDNGRKPGRLLKELKSLREILRRFGGETAASFPLAREGGSPRAVLGEPICILKDAGSSTCYAVWIEKPGESLEEILLQSAATKEASLHLNCYRRCLDTLFDHGIVWRDMSPRNILYSPQNGGEYHLVDFEKVDFLDRSLDQAAREQAMRYQFCVEELGVIIPESSLLDVFGDLFAPASWDVGSSAPLPFLPRVEIAAVMEGRGLSSITLGDFNRLDRQIWDVRRPRPDGQGGLIRCGLLGFRVEHYLSLFCGIDATDYDRKTTEILLAANAAGELLERVGELSEFIDTLETAVIIAEFEAILRSGDSRSIRRPESEAGQLCSTIDRMYARKAPSIHEHRT